MARPRRKWSAARAWARWWVALLEAEKVPESALLLAGAATGTAVAASKKGQQLQIPSESHWNFVSSNQ